MIRCGLYAVRLQIDGKLVAHHIYSAKELEALRKGGVQRIYVGNLATESTNSKCLLDGKQESGADFSRKEILTSSARSEAEAGGTDAGRTGLQRRSDHAWRIREMRAGRRFIALGLVLTRGSLPAPAGSDLRDLFFGEALYHAHQGQYFEALQRLDTELGMHPALDEPERDTLHYHIDNAEFSVGDFELYYRMDHRAGRAIKAVPERAVDEPVRNEAAYRLARIHFQKGQSDDAHER